MRKAAIVMGTIVLMTGGLQVVSAHEAKDLPAGPIRDRHELMEGMGKNAKIIGDALKSGDHSQVEQAAGKIQASATKIPGLFPPGSTDPKSRAKPEIWTNWKKFEENAKQLEASAGVLQDRVRSGGDFKVEAKKMFDTCKSCHQEFRVPEKDEKK
jgi:cytochrome c556